MGENLGVLLLYEGQWPCSFVDFAELRDLLSSGTVLITSNNHMADEVNTTVCMVEGKT